MSFDALTLAAVRDELEAELLGGQVQRVVQAGELLLGLEVYARRQMRFVLCSAEPLAARVCLSEIRPLRESDTPTPFLLLARKYVRDGRIVGVQQPAYERLLKVQITKRDEAGAVSEIDLIIEAMGRRSNVALVGADGLILDALKRVGPTRNPRRPILPHRPYLDPPPQQRLDPRAESTYAALHAAAIEQDGPLADLLASKLAGFSPLAAREAAFRATCDLNCRAAAADWDAVRRAVFGLLEPLDSRRWEPTVAVRDGEIVAFAPYRLTHLADVELQVCESISRAVERGLGGARPAVRGQPSQRALIGEVEAARVALERKLAALQRTLAAAERAAALQRAGEAILANLTRIEPGQASFEFDGLEFALDSDQSPLENAQRLFREYRKARDAARNVPGMVAASELRLRQLDELRVLAEVADSSARQRAVREELAELDGQAAEAEARGRGRGRDKRPERADGRLLKSRTPDGLEVLVGTSSRGNQSVTFDLARPDDLWLHARGVPGAHVILRTGGREPPPTSLLFAARLAARNSQSRAAGRVEVDYTLRKHVRKIGGGRPGLVTYNGEQTIAVAPDG